MQHKIGAYLRVSTEEQALAVEGSLDNQKYRLKTYVDGKNLQEKSWGKIIEYYIDDGYSAKDTNRPAYRRMLTDLKIKKIDFILVADFSRLSRNLLDFCELLNFLERYKSGFLSIKEQFDTSTSIGRMIVYQIITLAQFEREQTSERVALGAHSRAMRGLLNGGRAILGYDKSPDKPGSYVVNSDESKTVRKIFDVYLEEGSKARTIKKLNEQGIKPKPISLSESDIQDREWTIDNIGYMLSNYAYIGYHEVNKRRRNQDQSKLKQNQRHQIVKASWPGIISEELFHKVQEQLETSKEMERTRLAGASPRLYVLSGVLKCAECGQPLVGQSYHGYNEIYRYYGHTTKGAKHDCKVQRVSADEIESAVLKYLKTNLEDSEYFKHLQIKMAELSKTSNGSLSEEISRLESELGALERETTNIFRLQAQGQYSDEVLKMISERLEGIVKMKRQYTDALKIAKSKKDEAHDLGNSTEYIREKFVEIDRAFNKAPDNMKKRLMRSLFKQIVLSRDQLVFWFYLNDDDKETPGRKLKLVRDERGDRGLALVSGDNFESSKSSFRSLDICVNGDLTPT